MANVKTLQTRITLKFDTWTNWHNETVADQGANLVLLKGELGICEVPTGNAEATTAPTVLFKVGDGTSTFKSLSWASALAADVYSWAKASDVVLEDKKIKFVGTNKEISIPYVTESEVKAITDPLAARIAAVEAKFSGDASVEGQIAGLDARLDIIEGADTVNGSIAKALKDANTYTDTREAAIKTAYEAYADGAVEDAVAIINAKDEAQDASIEQEVKDRAAADTAINEKIGGSYSKTATVEMAIADAKKAGTDAAAAVDALSKGQVATNKNDIATNKADIAQLETDLDDEIQARKDADQDLSDRLDSIEAFFDAADHDGEDGGLTDALDTLKEIQDYLNGDGSAAGSVVDRIAANERAIDALEGLVEDGGTLDLRVDAVEASAESNSTAIGALQEIVDGYTVKGSVKTAIEAADAKGQQGITNAATAKAAADAAQKDVDDLAAVVNNEASGLSATKEIADKAKTDIAALTTRVTTAEGDIDKIETLVYDNNKGNEKLRTDVDALQTLTGDAAKGNNALYNEITRVAGIVEDSESGLAKTNEIADSALAKAEAIEADYLKAADAYIFNCGTATTVIHK